MNILIVCLFAIYVRAELGKGGTHDEWHTFKNLHGKQYATVEEENMRKSIFYNNKKMIEEHNSRYNNGRVTFKLKMNHFGDLLNHEYRAIANGFNATSAKNVMRTYPISSSINLNQLVELPDSIDWREKGAVTPVKNQLQCGSCWSFSTTGALEAQMFRKTGKLISLSEQNLIDCSVGYGNNGCHGGLMTQAFQYIKDNNGIDTEQSYPYEVKEGTCRFNPANLGGWGAGYRNIPGGSEEELGLALAFIGPVSVAIDASQGSFQFYSGGLYFDEHCSPVNLDHGVLAVGYGTENGNDYWLVKNSWGPNWGEGGYVKMARNRNNHCGIASMASYPIV